MRGFPLLQLSAKWPFSLFMFELWHFTCFNMHYVFILLNLFFCRYQNCVYTYRILPNEDKKLSVQVRKSQICMAVVTDLSWEHFALVPGMALLSYSHRQVLRVLGDYFKMCTETLLLVTSSIRKSPEWCGFFCHFSNRKAFVGPQKYLDTLISHKISFIRCKISNIGICKHLEISLKLTFHILFRSISQENHKCSSSHYLCSTQVWQQENVKWSHFKLYIIQLLNILVSNSEPFSVNCFAQEKCLFFIVQFF